jgi:hypothetical protein
MRMVAHKIAFYGGIVKKGGGGDCCLSRVFFSLRVPLFWKIYGALQAISELALWAQTPKSSSFRFA